ncbi:hypothetical protein V4S33_12530 [Enterococcus cecorum]
MVLTLMVTTIQSLGSLVQVMSQADGNIYRWSEMPNHYLIERTGMAGGTIRELGVGSQVTIDGRTYTIFKMLSGVANDENAYDLLISQGASNHFPKLRCYLWRERLSKPNNMVCDLSIKPNSI